jgi:hypothetical protein
MIVADASFAKVPLRRAATVGYNLACGELLHDDFAPDPTHAFVISLVSELGIELTLLNGIDLKSQR